MAIPVDKNINVKIAEKLTKYKILKIELQLMHDLRQLYIIPVVIGALLSFSQGLPDYLKQILLVPQVFCCTATEFFDTYEFFLNLEHEK